jgi:hypothetical protein
MGLEQRIPQHSVRSMISACCPDDLAQVVYSGWRSIVVRGIGKQYYFASGMPEPRAYQALYSYPADDITTVIDIDWDPAIVCT